MVNAGNIVIDPEVIATLSPAFLNGIGYMFSWGTAYNVGAVLRGLAAALGIG